MGKSNITTRRSIKECSCKKKSKDVERLAKDIRSRYPYLDAADIKKIMSLAQAKLPPRLYRDKLVVNKIALAQMLGNKHIRHQLTEYISKEEWDHLVIKVGFCAVCKSEIPQPRISLADRRARQLEIDEEIIREELLKHKDIADVISINIKVSEKPCSDDEPRPKQENKTVHPQKRKYKCWSAQVILKDGTEETIPPSRYYFRKRLTEKLSDLHFIAPPFFYDISSVKSPSDVRKFENQLRFLFANNFGYESKNIRVRMITSENVSPLLRKAFKEKFTEINNYLCFVFLGVERFKTYEPHAVTMVTYRDVKKRHNPIWLSGRLIIRARLRYIDRALEFQLQKIRLASNKYRSTIIVQDKNLRKLSILYAQQFKRGDFDLDSIPGRLIWIEKGARLSQTPRYGFFNVLATCEFYAAKKRYTIMKICKVKNIASSEDFMKSIKKWVRRSIAKRYLQNFILIDGKQPITIKKFNRAFRINPVCFVWTPDSKTATGIDALVKAKSRNKKVCDLMTDLKKKGVDGHTEFRPQASRNEIIKLMMEQANKLKLKFQLLKDHEQNIPYENIKTHKIAILDI